MKPIYINFKPSKILNAILILAAFVAISMLLLVEFSYVIKFTLMILIALSTIYYAMDKALLLMPWSYVKLHVDVKNEWKLQCKDGRNVVILISKDSVVTPHLTILNFNIYRANTDGSKSNNQAQNYLLSSSIVILPDNIDAESYRQLRVRLRWGQLTPD